VQILEIVAIIQIENLKIEAEKGFRRTLIDPELVDPNMEINFVKELGGHLSQGARRPRVHSIERETV